jgi:hypothetical protein
VGSAPQQREANCHKDVSRCMEEAIQKGVEFQVWDSTGRIAGAGDHVVPLKHLMQYDPVKEAAQAQPEKDSCGCRKPTVMFMRLVDSSLLPGGIARFYTVGNHARRDTLNAWLYHCPGSWLLPAWAPYSLPFEFLKHRRKQLSARFRALFADGY